MLPSLTSYPSMWSLLLFLHLSDHMCLLFASLGVKPSLELLGKGVLGTLLRPSSAPQNYELRILSLQISAEAIRTFH